MNDEMLTPTDYQAKRMEWTRETGGFLPSVEELVMRNNESLDKIRSATRQWAEEFAADHGMSGWNMDDEIRVEESFEGFSLVGSVTMRDPEMKPIGSTLPGETISDIQFISAAPPTRDDHDRTASMRSGMVARTSMLDPEEGALVLYKSWVTEDLDGMGIEVPWDTPEDFDREPVEE